MLDANGFVSAEWVHDLLLHSYQDTHAQNRNVSWRHVAESRDIQDYGELIKFIVITLFPW